MTEPTPLRTNPLRPYPVDADSEGVNEIEMYFEGLVHFEGDEPHEDGFVVQLSDAAVRFGSVAELASREVVPMADDVTRTTPKMSDKNSASGEESRNELELDWSAPHGEPHERTDQEQQVRAGAESPGRSEKPARPARKQSSEPVSEPAVTERAGEQVSSWEDLAKSLGVEIAAAPARPVSMSPSDTQSGKTSTRRPHREAQSRPISPSEPESPGFGTGLIESLAQPVRSPRSVDDDELVTKESMGFSGEQTNDVDDVTDELDYDESIAMVVDDDEYDLDDDFVEFEIEELDPAARRGDNRERPESPQFRPRGEAGHRSEHRTRSGGQQRDSENEGGDAKKDSDEESKSASRRGGRRGSRRRERKPDSSASGRGESRESGDSRGGRGSRRGGGGRHSAAAREPAKAEPKPRDEIDFGLDVGEDDAPREDLSPREDVSPRVAPSEVSNESQETKEPRDSREKKSDRAKTRNLPTWNETVGVIIQENIDSRKNQQPQRRRRGGRKNRRD